MARSRAALPEMPAHRRTIHERAVAMGFHAWTVVLGLPGACEEIGVPMPRWASELLEHANGLIDAAPKAVIGALADRGDKGGIECRSRAGRRWGLRLGVWERDRGGLVTTPFGDALASLWWDRQPPGEGPNIGAIGEAMGLRVGAIVRTARGAVGLITAVRYDGEIELVYRRGRVGRRSVGDELQILAGPGKPHPLRAELPRPLTDQRELYFGRLKMHS